MAKKKDSGPGMKAHLTRRNFARHVAGTGIGATMMSLLARVSGDETTHLTTGYGPLHPVADQSTGLELLCLPAGFRYSSFGWTGDVMDDGTVTPGKHDGMGVIHESDGIITLVRNHEVLMEAERFSPVAGQFDPQAGGGCATLQFDARQEKWLSALPSLTGTLKNCAGGTTPWGTWLTCEESVLGPGDRTLEVVHDFQQDHGWIFEVPATGRGKAMPLKAMGRFVHEAVAVDPASGIVYETEDRDTAGFYRFLPSAPGELQKGGRLQMMKVNGRDDVRTGIAVGQTFDVSWVDIEDVERAHSHNSTSELEPNGDQLGVFKQGKKQHATTFARLEGCWFGSKRIYLVSTSGGDYGIGQIWQFEPDQQKLTLLFVSPDKSVLDSPDNITVSPRGGLVLCEDGNVNPHRLRGMTPDGRLFPFAANNIVLTGQRNDHTGDFRQQEWAGVTFDAEGQWLFANIQLPGLSFAITGPWGHGLL